MDWIKDELFPSGDPTPIVPGLHNSWTAVFFEDDLPEEWLFIPPRECKFWIEFFGWTVFDGDGLVLLEHMLSWDIDIWDSEILQWYIDHKIERVDIIRNLMRNEKYSEIWNQK